MNRLALNICITLLMFGIATQLYAQKKTSQTRIDSSKIIHRKTKISCKKTGDKLNIKPLPLAYYNFSSQVHATFTYLDSNQQTTAITVYDFYIDDKMNEQDPSVRINNGKKQNLSLF